MSPNDPIRTKDSGPSNPVRGLGVYGGICTIDGVATQSISTTPVQVNQWNNNMPSMEVSTEFNVDRMVIQKSGVYQIFMQFSFSSSGGPAVWSAALRVNGIVPSNGLFWDRRVASAGGVGSASAMIFIELVQDDSLTVWVENDTGAFDFGVVQSQLTALLAGS